MCIFPWKKYIVWYLEAFWYNRSVKSTVFTRTHCISIHTHNLKFTRTLCSRLQSSSNVVWFYAWLSNEMLSLKYLFWAKFHRPKFLSNFSIFGRNINFFGLNFFHIFYIPRHSFVQKISSLLWKPDFLSIFIDFGRKLPILGDPPLLWTPCPDPPMIRTCPEKISYGPKRIVGNLQKISGRYGQR